MPGPAATVGNMHVCPMMNPTVPPTPHVGGPVTGPGVPTVLIGGMPAAVMGDMCTCAGPPDTIVQGEATVLVGGKPLATIGSMTAHGGAITVGVPTVLIGTGGSGATAIAPIDEIPFPQISFWERIKLKIVAFFTGMGEQLKEAFAKIEELKEEALNPEATIVENALTAESGEDEGSQEEKEACRFEKVTIKEDKDTIVLFEEGITSYTGQTMVYETISGDKDSPRPRELTLKVDGFVVENCSKNGTEDEHRTEVKIIDYKGKEDIFPGTSAIKQKVFGPEVRAVPFNFLFPHKADPTTYRYHIHSCRYYSNNRVETLRVEVFPDIKWDFHFFLNLSNKLSVKWNKLPAGKDQEMRKEAGKIGAEKRWGQTEIDFGVLLEANWNKLSDDRYHDSFKLTPKFEKSIKQLYNVFGALKEISKYITGETKGKVTSTRLGKKLPFEVVMEPPNFTLGAEWQCARGAADNKPSPDLGTEIDFYLKAQPLVNLELVIDLLDLAVNAAVAGATGGMANTVANEIFDGVRIWLADENKAVSLDMYIDLKLFGKIEADAEFTFNTEAPNKAETKLDTTVGITLEAGLKAKARVTAIVVEFYVLGEISAKGEGSITFGHQLKYIGSSQNASLYYMPRLLFDGIKVQATILGKVGMEIRKEWIQFSSEKKLADLKVEKTLFKPFDILEKIYKTEVQIPLIKE